MNLNLESKINLIYQFLHEDLENDCYNISRINLKNIKIEDIKVPLNFEYKNEILKEFMKANFQFISHKNNIYKFKRITDGFSSSVNIAPYSYNEKENNITIPQNNDALFSYVLSSLVLQEKTKNLLLPIMNIDVKFDDIKEILKPYPTFNEFKDNIETEKIKDIFSISIKEEFFKSDFLSNYFEENSTKYIKDILFQIFHCLYIIQKEYPNFIHNNLIVDNIIIVKDNIPSDKIYILEGNKYYLKNSKLTIKMSFFENSICEEINGKTSKKNRYYDIYTFLDSIKNNSIYEKLDSETKKFIDENLNKNPMNEFITARDILKNKYFNVYKKISNETYMSNKFNNFSIMNLESDNKSTLGNQSDMEELSSQYNDIKLRRVEKKNRNNYTGSRNIKKEYSKKRSKKSSLSSKRTIKLNQTGGEFRKSNNPYKKERNDPRMSNDARDTYNKFKQEKPPKKYEPPILAEQKIYDTQKSKQGKPQDYVPTNIPIMNPLHGQYHPLYPYESQANKVNIVKPVNITFSNPVNGNHMALNRVYEDMLPGDNFVYSLKSVFERKQLTNFLRGMILEEGDGEEISITTGGNKSLLSFIRLIEINPYNMEKNPYKSLSKGFLLYSSAYPVRYDNERNHLGIAKQSLGINVRIYELTQGAYQAEKIGNKINCDDFDIWREIKYYEYVREDILKNKISPNFVSLYLYTTDSNSKINYEELNTIRLNGKPNNEYKQEQENLYKINNKHEIDPLQFLIMNSYGIQAKQYKDTTALIKSDYIPSQNKINNLTKYLGQRKYIIADSNNVDWNWTREGINFLNSKNYYQLDFTGRDKPNTGSKVTGSQIRTLAIAIGKVDYTTSISKSLIALTESPTSPLLDWASPTSENFGTVQRMTETGYHTPEVWKSIIFQMVYTFAVLQEHNIYFKKLSLKNNFFIKDLFSNNERRDHWIYKVNDINYYIPNYGYLLMFDSKNVDIMNENKKTIGITPTDELMYKIQSDNIYPNKNNMNKNSINIDIYNAFKNTMNPDNFRINLERTGGLKPDDSVFDLLTKIYNHNDSNQSIKNFLEQFFTEFMHNRIGNRLTNDEMSVIGNMYINNFKKGELVAYRKGHGEYLWAIFLGRVSQNSRRVRIAVRTNNGDIINVSTGSLRKLPTSETIKQESKNRVLYDSEYTIETYTLK